MEIDAAAMLVCILLCSIRLGSCATPASDVAALRAFKGQIIDNNNRLANWRGDEPCASDNSTQHWEGVFCTRDANNVTRVTELRLLNHQLSGTLAPELGNLDKLRIFDVMRNQITGSIPPSFGMLKSLELLLVNGNRLTGVLPPELGNLTNMNRIQIDENTISGPVPATFGNLTNVKHFHMNNNSLNGSIPPDLQRLPNIVHILFDNNMLTGKLPAELSRLKTLRILQLDNNRFDDDATIPAEYGNITTLFKLSLRNCNLRGLVPDLSRINELGYLDLSKNALNGTIPTGLLSRNITSIDLSFNNLTGGLPASYGSLPMLQSLMVQNNILNGPLRGSLFGSGVSSPSLVFDLQNNNFSSVDTSFIGNATVTTRNVSVWLSGNTQICSNPQPQLARACAAGNVASVLRSDQGTVGANTIFSCTPDICSVGSELVPNIALCRCASPAVINYRLKSPGFMLFEQFRSRFDRYISSGLDLNLTQVYVKNATWETGPRLAMFLSLYPIATSQNASDRSLQIPELRRLYQKFANWGIPDDDVFGPYEFLGFTPPFGVNLYDITGAPSSSKLSGGALAGILVACIFATGGLVGAVVFFLMLRKSKYRSKSSRLILAEKRRLNESLKLTGLRAFTFKEMKVACDSFSDSRVIGQGGYGKVYRGFIDDGHVVAIKRAQEGSLQGAAEFYKEIELLSRVHHRNLVSLLGYCDDEGEQMLIYEFMEGGNLRERLSPTVMLPLDFATRLRIALGSARGILYLHTEANPSIFHRDIKASNILLDAKNTAKVADFGLSRLAPSPDFDGSTPSHVSTVVKGTPGYLDPEYFLTRQLTDKSDVYSFGVVLLELITGLHPISQGKNLVREAKMAYESGSMLHMVDKRMGTYPSEGIEPMMKLAVLCCNDTTDNRPSMAEVVRDLEDLWRSMPWSDAFSTFESDTVKGGSKGDAAAMRRMSSEDFNNELYVSSSVVADPSMQASMLFSGTVPNVAPR